jgi:hypothetical protein
MIVVVKQIRGLSAICVQASAKLEAHVQEQVTAHSDAQAAHQRPPDRLRNGDVRAGNAAASGR